jgi:manganese efflux pump family protein
MAKLVAFVLPLSLDTFVAAAALGLTRRGRRARLRVSVVLSAFELAMPLVGLGAGRAVGAFVGGAASVVAGAGLIALGAYIALAEDEQRPSEHLADGRLALAAVGLGVSLDELAVGFGIGLLGLPLLPALVLIAVQAFGAAQLGLAVGSRLRPGTRKRAEQLAGAALAALGVWLLAERLLT